MEHVRLLLVTCWRQRKGHAVTQVVRARPEGNLNVQVFVMASHPLED